MKHRDLILLPQSKLQIVKVCKVADASGGIFTVNSDYPFIPIRVVGDVAGTTNIATWTGSAITLPTAKKYILGFMSMGLAYAVNGVGSTSGNTDANEFYIDENIDKGQFLTESINITMHSDAKADGTYYITCLELRPKDY